MISLADVTKKFPGGTVALETANLEINDGEFVFLVGPSGSGKTTILRLILRSLTATSGRILVDEHD